ncbi:PAS domain S-box protein [Pelomyxa schiedti]|nr:PAS domain S-box protein [Pelomyxa schiedti]
MSKVRPMNEDEEAQDAGAAAIADTAAASAPRDYGTAHDGDDDEDDVEAGRADCDSSSFASVTASRRARGGGGSNLAAVVPITEASSATEASSRNLTDGSSSKRRLSLTGERNMLIDVLWFVMSKSWRLDNFKNWRVPLYCLELIQLASFALDDRYMFPRLNASSSGSGLDGETPSERTENAFYYIFFGLRHLRDPTASTGVSTGGCTAAVVVSAVAVTIHMILMAVQMKNVAMGGIGWHKVSVALRTMHVFTQSLIIPLGYMLLHPLISVIEANTFSLSVGCIWFLLLFCDSGYSAFFCNDFRPSSSVFAVAQLRYSCFVHLMKMILILNDVILANGFFSLKFGDITTDIYPFTLSTLLLSIFMAFLISLPFYNKYLNNLSGMFFSGTLASSCALYAGLYSSHHEFPWYAISLALFVFGLLFGFLFVQIRILLLNVKFHRLHKHRTYLFPFQCELETRFIYHKAGPSQADIQRVEDIFAAGLQDFPGSQYLTVMHAIFLIEKKLSWSEGLSQLNAIDPSSFVREFQYMRYSVSLSKDKSLNERKVEEQIAAAHCLATKQALCTFWLQLTKSKNKIEPNGLLSVLSAMHEHSSSAENLYRKLLRDNPHSPQCMRNLAKFLEEIKDDREESEILQQMAEEHDNFRKNPPRSIKKGQLRFAEQFSPDNLMNPSSHEEIGKKLDSRLSVPGSLISSRRSSFDHVSASGSVYSSSSGERGILLSYRQRIESKKSYPLLLMRIFGIFVLIAGFFNVVILCIVATYTTSDLIDYTKAISYPNRFSSDMTSLLHDLRLCETDAKTITTPYDIEEVKLQLPGLLRDSRLMLETAITSDGSSSERYPWDLPNIRIKHYFGKNNVTEDNFWFRNESLYQASTQALAFAEQILAQTNDSDVLSDLDTNIEFRFLLDNLIQTIIEPMHDVSAKQADINRNFYQLLTRRVYYYIPLALLQGILLAVFIYLPLEYAIKKERAVMVSLFAEIPTATALNMLGKVSSNLITTDVLSPLVESTVHAISQLRTFLVCTLAIFLSQVLTISLIILFYTTGDQGNDVSIEAGEKILQTTQGMLYLSEEMIRNDIVTWAPGSLNSTFWMYENEYQQSYTNLNFASGIDDDWFLVFTTECPTFGNFSIKCTGLDGMMNIFLENLRAFSFQPPWLQTWDSDYIQIPIAISETMFSWVEGLVEEVSEEATASLEVSSVIFKAIMGITLPICLVLFYAFNYSINRLDVEFRETLKILLSLPLDIIQGTVLINRFLETGSIHSLSLKHSVEEKEKKTRLLDGSKDAVIVLNERGTIESFNPSAESLFECTSKEVLGRHASIILPDTVIHPFSVRMEMLMNNTLKQQKNKAEGNDEPPALDGMELIISNKEEKEVPVLLSVTEIVTKDGVTVAMFLKDISNLKAQQAIIENQKKHTESLLENILPKMIKEKLEINPDKLIAEKYKNVTVAFADIVEFTPMASKMRPWELVSMLNSLFSAWDGLLDSYHVEKIKTIGDCYMVTGGMPEESNTHAEDVLELVIAMFSTLERYNTLHDTSLHIRVGINTGPVVAGVIGKKKWAFDIWGDTVNTASRLESSGVPDRIQVSEITKDLLVSKGYQFESRGVIQIKGKGETECFLLAEPKLHQAKRPIPEVMDSKSMTSAY